MLGFHVFEPAAWLWLSKLMGSHCGVGTPPMSVCFSGDRDVHWGYDLDFEGTLFQVSLWFGVGSDLKPSPS